MFGLLKYFCLELLLHPLIFPLIRCWQFRWLCNLYPFLLSQTFFSHLNLISVLPCNATLFFFFVLCRLNAKFQQWNSSDTQMLYVCMRFGSKFFSVYLNLVTLLISMHFFLVYCLLSFESDWYFVGRRLHLVL